MTTHSREFLEEMLAMSKEYLPKWLHASLVKAARAKSGGKAKANRAKQRKIELESKRCDEEKSVSKALISFVVSELSPVEKARNEALIGATGDIFKELYLDPLGIDREDVHITKDVDELEDINPCLVIALGKASKKNLGIRADHSLPHPEAVRKYGDSGEVDRKLNAIWSNLLDKYDKKCYYNDRQASNKPIVEYKADSTGEELTSKISKEAPMKRIVYGVVVDPYGANGAQADAHNDWMPPDEVEKMAHNYLQSSRVIGLQHVKKADAKVVESWVEQYPSREDYLKALNGEEHKVSRRKFGDDFVHSGSWIMGVELGEKEWELFKSGKVTAFSPGGFGVRRPLNKAEMPKVTFVELVEKSNMGENIEKAIWQVSPDVLNGYLNTDSTADPNPTITWTTCDSLSVDDD